MKPDVFIRFLGIAFFAISFVVPNAEPAGNGISWSTAAGFHTFLMTPVLCVGLIINAGEWRSLLVGIALAAAWLTNFTVFFRLPRVGSWIPMTTPWVLYITFCLNWYPNGRSVVGFLPFYPWAAGLFLTHGATYICVRLEHGKSLPAEFARNQLVQ